MPQRWEGETGHIFNVIIAVAAATDEVPLLLRHVLVVPELRDLPCHPMNFITIQEEGVGRAGLVR